jgi:integrase
MARRERRAKGANGNGGASKRADGSWQWRVTLDDGRRIYGYGKTQVEAKRKCVDKAKQAAAGIDVKAARQSLGEFLDSWLVDVVKPQLAPKTYVSYRDTVRKHITPALGKIELGKLTPQHVQALLREKEREKRHSSEQVEALCQQFERTGNPSSERLAAYRRDKEQEPKLSPRTVAYIRTVLRIALTRAMKWNLVERNVAALADVPRQVRAERIPLTPEQAAAFLREAEGDRLEALYLVTAMLGLRLGEGLGLRWQDVELDTGTLRVRQAVQRVDGQLIIKEPKTAKSRRTLTLPAIAIESLRRHRDRQTFEANTAKSWLDSGLVFTNNCGGPLEPSNVLKRFKATLAAAGLPKQRFHDLRHYAASFLLAHGVPMRVVMDILGHSQMATTADLYAHVMPAAHREVADLLDRAFGGPRS